MPIASGNPINVNEIINGFMTNVYNPIVSGCYDNTNIPEEQEYSWSPRYQMIDASLLGNLDANKAIIQNYLNNIGVSGGAVNAATLAQFMSLALQVLRKVGTWSYVRKYNDNGTYIIKYSSSGKAIFSDAYTAQYISVFGDNQLSIGTVPGPGIQSNEIISASRITTYYTILLQKWNSIIKPAASLTNYTCHSDCHNDCHTDCHTDCNCYK